MTEAGLTAPAVVTVTVASGDAVAPTARTSYVPASRTAGVVKLPSVPDVVVVRSVAASHSVAATAHT